MRRIISVFLTLMIVMTSLTVSFGNKSLNKVLLLENGRGRNFEVLNLKIDGEIIESEDVPPVMYVLNNQGRTLIPLRMIIEHVEDVLDADIEWDQEKYEVRVTTKDKEITLKIDSPIAIVNGEEKRLPDDVPAKLLTLNYTSRTMVPIRFFAEELGFDVDWDNDTRTALLYSPEKVEDIPEDNPKLPPKEDKEDREDKEDIAEIVDVNIEMNGSTPQIRIKTSEEVDYDEFKLVNPDRLVIDLLDTKFDYKDKDMLESIETLNTKIDDISILDVFRMSQFEENPYTTRMVMEIDSSTEHEISFDKRNSELVIDFNNYIHNVRRENLNAKEVIIIEGDSISDYNVMELSGPERLVVDIEGASLHKNFSTRNINIDGNVAESIRLSQSSTVDNKSVRVVVDIKEDSNYDYDKVYIEEKDGRLYLHLEGQPLETLEYQEVGWTTSRLTFKGNNVTRYSLSRRQGSNIMEITVPRQDIELELASLNVNDHIIKTMDIRETGNNYNIKLELQDSVEYDLVSSENSKDFVLEMNNKEAKYREKLIVIDPGHGGSDPGTTAGSLGVHESQIVLDIGIRLNQLLTEAGFRTYMTRADDNLKVELEERTDIANSLNADLFLSIHVNSFTSSSINGIENYYHSTDPEGRKVAQIFQEQMIKDLNAYSRGHKQANFRVLRESNMPSVLSEVGFISNPAEEQKLVDPNYRQQIAESMFRATIKYFEQLR